LKQEKPDADHMPEGHCWVNRSACLELMYQGVVNSISRACTPSTQQQPPQLASFCSSHDWQQIAKQPCHDMHLLPMQFVKVLTSRLETALTAKQLIREVAL